MSSRPLLGGSGADLSHAVIKSGSGAVGERVEAQGDWIAAHADIAALPRLFGRLPGGYVMERLDPIDWETVDWKTHVRDTVDTLAAYFWNRPAEVEPDLDEHLAFVRSRCPADLWPQLKAWAGDVEWTDPVLIHGDPTFDNQCRRGDELVLIDPNPATPATPSVRAMDLANIAQSLHGYEAMKYGRPVPPVGPDYLRVVLDLDDGEWDLVRYLTAVKFVRILAYEPNRRPTFLRFARHLVDTR